MYQSKVNNEKTPQSDANNQSLSSTTTQVDYIFKIILVGSQSVGKSALLTRFVENVFNDSYIATIGVDFQLKTLRVENKNIKLQIWDTAGQQRFGCITSSHYKGAHGCLCVYDITSQKSLQDAEVYLNEAISQYGVASERCFLIGNKIDLGGNRLISQDQGQAIAVQYNAQFMESSAKSNKNVDELFFLLTQSILSQIVLSDSTNDEDNNNQNQKVLTDQSIQIPQKSCC